jgi:hypothetical protein
MGACPPCCSRRVPQKFPLMSASAEVKVTRHPSAELTDDMTVADLLDVLEHLPFGQRGGSCMLQLDRGVRDYLLRALRRR